MFKRFIAPLGAGAITLALAGGGGEPSVAYVMNRDAARSVTAVKLAVDGQGRVVLAWQEDTRRSGDDQERATFVKRFENGAWRNLGANLNYLAARTATDLDLALDQSGNPVLAWNENFAHADTQQFRAWTGSAWTNWPERRISQDLTLAAKARGLTAWNGEPIFASGDIVRKGTGTVLRVRSWHNGSWIVSPNFSDDPARYAYAPSAAMTRDGRVVVAWLEGNVAASDVRVKRWNGGRWERLGGNLNVRPNTFTFAPALKLDVHDRPVVSWLEDHGGYDTLFVKRWTGSAWQALGGGLNVNAERAAEAPSLALDGLGRPVVAWSEGTPEAARVYVKRWTGASWRLLSVGSVNADFAADARTPSVGVDASGTVTVAWREKRGGVYHLLLRTFRS
ncbi:hypothetical protein [Deinococcus yavapaiensis]|uniref:BNR repeat neuraminidase n=1 Tax=Deinococcus yavapaiensis KR-236 TaxID=694435 RepID=A0A318SJX3_9DEIO|nr:hypothetical protein [Deinococcus yavapaiensis]PYE52858.1 hypothetical protein DES52_11129 [Deinococcus yavapaiensis KR-236]